MKPFSDFFNFLQAQALSAARWELMAVRNAWRESSQRAWIVIGSSLVVSVIAAVLGLTFGPIMTLAIFAPAAMAAIIATLRSERKLATYKNERAAFADNCNKFKAVVVAIKLCFAPGRDRWFVAILFRPTLLVPGGACLHYFSEQTDSRRLIELLVRNEVYEFVYPELISARARSAEEALDFWKSSLGSVSDMFGFTQKSWDQVLFEELHKLDLMIKC